MGLDLSPIATYLCEHDGADARSCETGLAIETLGELGRRSYRDSVVLLLAHLAEGARWDLALNALVETGQFEPVAARAVDILEGRFSSESDLEDCESFRSIRGRSMCPRMIKRSNAFSS